MIAISMPTAWLLTRKDAVVNRLRPNRTVFRSSCTRAVHACASLSIPVQAAVYGCSRSHVTNPPAHHHASLGSIVRQNFSAVTCRAASVAPENMLPPEFWEFGEVDELRAELPFDLDTQDMFLRKYWQKRPLLIRQAIPEFKSPLQPEELAGLACEDGVASRIVLEKGGVQPWEMRYGPFTEESFFNLPETHYSLLVQGVDRHVPEVSEIMDLFPFIPRWRFDDVQVSYSPANGTVGPHSDNFDVFLLQADGPKSWAVSTNPKYDVDDLHAHEEPASDETPVVRIVKDWVPEMRRTLRPGDMLYLPPKTAHHGVAQSPGCTYSVGFLAPKHQDMVISYVDHLAGNTDYDVERWEDSDLARQMHHGDIQPAALDFAETVISSLLKDRKHLAKWFGTHVTVPQGGPDPRPLSKKTEWSEFASSMSDVGEVRLLESMRAAYIDRETIGPPDATMDLFFVNGHLVDISTPAESKIARALAASRKITTDELVLAGVDLETSENEPANAVKKLLLNLFDDGMLYFLADDAEDYDQDLDEEPEFEIV